MNGGEGPRQGQHILKANAELDTFELRLRKVNSENVGEVHGIGNLNNLYATQGDAWFGKKGQTGKPKALPFCNGALKKHVPTPYHYLTKYCFIGVGDKNYKMTELALGLINSGRQNIEVQDTCENGDYLCCIPDCEVDVTNSIKYYNLMKWNQTPIDRKGVGMIGFVFVPLRLMQNAVRFFTEIQEKYMLPMTKDIQKEIDGVNTKDRFGVHADIDSLVDGILDGSKSANKEFIYNGGESTLPDVIARYIIFKRLYQYVFCSVFQEVVGANKTLEFKKSLRANSEGLGSKEVDKIMREHGVGFGINTLGRRGIYYLHYEKKRYKHIIEGFTEQLKVFKVLSGVTVTEKNSKSDPSYVYGDFLIQ